MARPEGPSIDELVVAADPARWSDAGFRVERDECRVGGALIRLAGETAGRGLVEWSLRAVASDDLDGLPTRRSEAPPAAPAAIHPNGVTGLDHVVVFSPALDRTVAALEAAGLSLRRIRDEPTPAGAPRQAFFRLREVVLEVIQQPEPIDTGRPARLWGLAFAVEDLEALSRRLGHPVGPVRDAVQAGRRIATAERDAGLGLPVAFMSAGRRRASASDRTERTRPAHG